MKKNLRTKKKKYKKNQRIFTYQKDGETYEIKSTDVNEYLGEYTTKNFRTWSANVLLIGDLLNKPVHIGPKGKNPLHALSKIEIIPKRYQQTFGEYKYTDLMYGIKKVINSAEEQLNLYK